MAIMRRQQRSTDYDNATLEADSVIHYPDGTVEYVGMKFSMRGRSQTVEELAAGNNQGGHPFQQESVTSQYQPQALPSPSTTPVMSWRQQMAADIAAVREQRSLPEVVEGEYRALPPGS